MSAGHSSALTPADHLGMARQAYELAQLPETGFEPFAHDWQLIDWSEDRPDIGADDADAMARDIEQIRNLPECRSSWS